MKREHSLPPPRIVVVALPLEADGTGAGCDQVSLPEP